MDNILVWKGSLDHHEDYNSSLLYTMVYYGEQSMYVYTYICIFHAHMVCLYIHMYIHIGNTLLYTVINNSNNDYTYMYIDIFKLQVPVYM